MIRQLKYKASVKYLGKFISYTSSVAQKKLIEILLVHGARSGMGIINCVYRGKTSSINMEIGTLNV